jgi:hypothetical protein
MLLLKHFYEICNENIHFYICDGDRDVFDLLAGPRLKSDRVKAKTNSVPAFTKSAFAAMLACSECIARKVQSGMRKTTGRMSSNRVPSVLISGAALLQVGA